jgi:hypothetical protein
MNEVRQRIFRRAGRRSPQNCQLTFFVLLLQPSPRNELHKGIKNITVRDKLSRFIEDTSAKADSSEPCYPTRSPGGNLSIPYRTTCIVGFTNPTPEILLNLAAHHKITRCSLRHTNRLKSCTGSELFFLTDSEEVELSDVDCAREKRGGGRCRYGAEDFQVTNGS